MILSTIRGRLLVSHFKVLSLLSGRMLPHLKYCWMSRSTWLRSAFWLTDRLGRTSHPTNNVGRGEIDTVKHPSPSTYPEMYDGKSRLLSTGEPAYCSRIRFAIVATVAVGYDSF
jgi:hypothetical protein